MNFDNDEESLGFINRLLERLHQADYINLTACLSNFIRQASTKLII